MTSGKDALSLKKLLKDAQELDPLYKRLASRLHSRTQYGASLALAPGSLPHRYSVDRDGLLRYVNRVLMPAQEALRHQLLKTYHDYGTIGH